jgi:inosine-uridine nucleoside N-ribohydrolase
MVFRKQGASLTDALFFGKRPLVQPARQTEILRVSYNRFFYDPRFANPGQLRMAKKLIVDCDVGVDDALALILAFHSPELAIEAVTGVSGNVPLDLVFENIQKVLCLIQPKNKPLIAKGAHRPLKGEPVYTYSFHGKSGLGKAKIKKKKHEEWHRIFSGRADELIPKLARQHPNELTLIAVGPLTNVALALQKDLEGMKKLKEVVIMGGAVRVKGNVTPYAEFNIFVDPLAARAVFESGLPITLVPLDVTHQVYLTSRVMEEKVKPLYNPFSQFVIEATRYNSNSQRFLEDSEVFYLHDPLAVGVAINQDLVGMERLSIDVDTREGDSYGRTKEVEGNSKINACLSVNSKIFLELFLSRVYS